MTSGTVLCRQMPAPDGECVCLVDPVAAAVGIVRHLALRFVAEQRLDVDPGDTALVVSELFTNAVRHANGGRRYWVTFMPVRAGLLVRVVDDSQKLPVIPDHGSLEDDEGGHGVELIRRLTIDFLVVTLPRGKAVSATIPFEGGNSAGVIMAGAARAA